MEIKFTFENEDQEIKTWIDSVSGALCIESQNEVIEVPYMVSIELLSMLRQKQAQFEEANSKNWFEKLWR